MERNDGQESGAEPKKTWARKIPKKPSKKTQLTRRKNPQNQRETKSTDMVSYEC